MVEDWDSNYDTTRIVDFHFKIPQNMLDPIKNGLLSLIITESN